jgi:hypothetical protein
MRTVNFLLIAIMILFANVTVACGAKQAPDITYYEATGNPAKRIANITAMLTKFHTPPTALLDAQFVEEKIGDGDKGPADFHTFFMVQVAPENIKAWQTILTPLDTTPDYAAPTQMHEWWVTKDDFATLQFYAPDTLAGRSNGWVAINPQGGKIFIYTYTT